MKLLIDDVVVGGQIDLLQRYIAIYLGLISIELDEAQICRWRCSFRELPSTYQLQRLRPALALRKSS